MHKGIQRSDVDDQQRSGIYLHVSVSTHSGFLIYNWMHRVQYLLKDLTELSEGVELGVGFEHPLFFPS